MGVASAVNRFVAVSKPTAILARNTADNDQRAIRFLHRPDPVGLGLEAKETIHGSRGHIDQTRCISICFAIMSYQIYGRRVTSPVRFTLTSTLGSGLDGAWWPHTASIARELSDLTGALRARLGKVIDIGVNWSPLEGVPDLDLLNRRGLSATPGRENRQLRVMTLTGSQERAHLLVVPCQTRPALAVMLLRHAADLPVIHAHLNTPACLTAGVIVRAARDQSLPEASSAETSS